MSQVYFGSRTEEMARQLGDMLVARLRDAKADPFEPIQIVVPNPYLGKWLKLYLSTQLGITFNVQFSLLEQELWRMLRELDPRPIPEPEQLDGDLYRFLVLGVLLEHRGHELEGLRNYMSRAEVTSPSYWRRAWDLADRMSSLIRDYEYHRQEPLITPWLQHKAAYPRGLPDHDRLLERAQGTLFYEIVREPAGRRKTLNDSTGRNFKTLPQYAGELFYDVDPKKLKPAGRTVYLFGITQMSELHARTLAWLSSRFDLRLYVLTPLADAIASAGVDGFKGLLEQRLDDYRREGASGSVQRWMRAGVESLWRLQQLIKPDGPLDWKVIDRAASIASKPSTVLTALQWDILHPAATARQPNERLDQDCSLQIVGCPGVQREVETVYQSILHNLQTNPSLRMTDIAVLVTDMETYRPALQAMFERDGKLRYSLIDHSAAGVSLWGQALLGMLDLAQENFARSRVFEVVLNPCVLTRLRVDRADAQVWLHWAEELGVYHGWDADEREERGAEASSLFAWRHALQRLRLGRCMDRPSDLFESTGRFGNLVPHEDIHSSDRRRLDAFCRSIEGLLPILVNLRSLKQTGRWWAERIRLLTHMFLAIPEDRPEEARVRDQLLDSLEQLELWDDLHKSDSEHTRIPLALVRQFVQSCLQGISASKGEPLVAGVTISALQPMRPVPFQVIYVLGMNESLFPGRNALSSLDLRSHRERELGDVLPAEQNLYLFLEVVLSAQSKLYLLYNNRELQRDRELLPAVPLLQLKRHVQETILREGEEFQFAKAPLHGHDLTYLFADSAGCHDVLCQYDSFARAMAVQEGLKRGAIELSPAQQDELRKWRKERQRSLTNDGVSESDTLKAVTLTLKRLRDFLLNPAKAILKQRLQIDEEMEREASDDEPFVSGYLVGRNVLHAAMREAIRQYLKGTLPQELENWVSWIDPVHEDFRLRCKAPSGPFGDVDRLNLCDEFKKRLEGDDETPGLKAFLDQRPASDYCGPILLGESASPIGAKRQFTSLKLSIIHASDPSRIREVAITGHIEHVWHQPGQSLDMLYFSYSKDLKSSRLIKPLLEPLLFCLGMLAHVEGQMLVAGQSGKNIRWNIHLLAPDGVQTWSFAPDQIGPEEATSYLTTLVSDYLNDTAFDMLPLELLEKELYATVIGTAETPLSEAEFQEALADKVEEARERDHSWDSPLLQLLGAEVPPDALIKCQRRLRLLDEGLRAEQTEEEPRKPRKSKKTEAPEAPDAAKEKRPRKARTRSK